MNTARGRRWFWFYFGAQIIVKMKIKFCDYVRRFEKQIMLKKVGLVWSKEKYFLHNVCNYWTVGGLRLPFADLS